jgi:DHA1 family inner membrane transport protein
MDVSTAGQLVTAYALGIAIGAPILTALTTRFGRRRVLRIALAAFVAGNVLAAVATSFGMLLIARVLTGSIHGLFIGVASVIAAGLVAPERRGQAISMVFGGIAVATVLGVPAGTLIGQTLGWHAAFAAIVALAVVALVASFSFIPEAAGRGSGGLRTQARAAFAPRVLAILAVGLLLMGGQFTAFTYLTPFLGKFTGVTGGLVSVFLLAFGIAAAVGTVIGGRAADHSATTTLLIANGALIAALGALYLVGATPVLVIPALAAWGLAGFAIIPALQLLVITLAGAGGDLAATLGASAVNAGIAAGSLIGGAVLAVVRYTMLSEAAVRESGLVWTILRPSGSYSNALQWVPQLRDGDVVREPFADVPIAAIDPFDIAAVAALALTVPGHEGASYRLTGPAPILPADRVRILAELLERELRLEALTNTEARAQMSASMPAEYVDAFFSFFVDGTYDDAHVQPTVKQLTGRAPRTSEQWATAHADAFR